MNPLLAALVGFMGAIVGAAGAVATVAIQAYYQTKRERLKMVSELAIEEHRIVHEIATRQGGAIPPLSLFVNYHAEIARIVETRALTAADLLRLAKQMEELYQATPDPGRPKGERGN